MIQINLMLKKVVKTSNILCAVLMSKNILADFTQIYNIADAC